MQNVRQKNTITFIGALCVIGLFVFLFSRIDTEALIARIGIENGYLIAAGIAFLGGMSSITGAAFLGIMTLLATGGLHPLLLGLVAMPGMVFGDYVFYRLAESGLSLVRNPSWLQRVFSYVERFAERRMSVTFFLSTYVLVAIVPMPGDILMALFAFGNVRFEKFIVPVALGHITFVSLFAYVTKLGLEWIF